jgi:hypothetical protein
VGAFLAVRAAGSGVVNVGGVLVVAVASSKRPTRGGNIVDHATHRLAVSRAPPRVGSERVSAVNARRSIRRLRCSAALAFSSAEVGRGASATSAYARSISSSSASPVSPSGAGVAVGTMWFAVHR